MYLHFVLNIIFITNNRLQLILQRIVKDKSSRSLACRIMKLSFPLDISDLKADPA